MRKVLLVLLGVFLVTSIRAQSVAFMKMTEPDGSSGYLNQAIVEGLKEAGLNAKMFSNYQLFSGYNNTASSLNQDQIANLKMFNHDFVILHKAEITNQSYKSICYSTVRLERERNWQSEFIVINVKTNQSALVNLAISTYDCGDLLGSCSNLDGFAKDVKEFV